MLSKELNLVELESMIQSDAEAEINQSQKELGDTEDLSIEIDEYRDQIKHLNLPEKAPEAAGRELMMKRKKQSQHKSRLFLGIVFKCCNIYSRIHLNKKRTAFVGWCPKCAKPARVRVSPTGSKSRFFFCLLEIRQTWSINNDPLAVVPLTATNLGPSIIDLRP